MRHADPIRAVGAANGTFALERHSCAKPMMRASAAAEAALTGHQGGEARAAGSAEQPDAKPIEPIWFSPATGKYNEGNKHFVDFQNDVTAADLELAQREGYKSVEHTKRYTTFGMATDQGKTSGIWASACSPNRPASPFPRSERQLSGRPTRPSPSARSPARSPAAASCRCAARRSSTGTSSMAPMFEPVGQWRRAYTYPKGSEDKHAAIRREILSVRNKVGLLDASTLGKIEIRGPDAAEFLDRVYTNTFSTLKVGRCRYGLMLNELGFLIDDGVTVRLGDDHFLMHTTSGGADRIAAWLEEWLQTEWMHYKVFVTPVTEQWAQFAIAGPKARDVLAKLSPDFDISNEAFPHLSMKQGKLGAYPVRVFRISFSGELSYEVAVPANYGRGLWDAYPRGRCRIRYRVLWHRGAAHPSCRERLYRRRR